MNAIHSRLTWRVKQVLNINKTAQDRFAIVRPFCDEFFFFILKCCDSHANAVVMGDCRQWICLQSGEKGRLRTVGSDQWADWSFHNGPNEAKIGHLNRSDWHLVQAPAGERKQQMFGVHTRRRTVCSTGRRGRPNSKWLSVSSETPTTLE